MVFSFCTSMYTLSIVSVTNLTQLVYGQGLDAVDLRDVVASPIRVTHAPVLMHGTHLKRRQYARARMSLRQHQEHHQRLLQAPQKQSVV